MLLQVDFDRRRRDARYRVKVPLSLRSGSSEQSIVTEDVSFRGLFARTDSPPTLRQLIRVEGELPPGGMSFSSHAMAVYVLEADNEYGRAPGVGIQFYAMGPERATWEAFINHVKEGNPPLADPTAPEPIRRRHPRYELVLPVRPRNLEDLLTLYSRDVSQGGMFLSTERNLTVGASLRLDVEHPETREVFPLEAQVRRTEPSAPGVGVEFIGMDPERKDAFFEFAHGAVPELNDLDLVEEDDPSLE